MCRPPPPPVCIPIFGTSEAVYEALDEPYPNPFPWIDRSGGSSDFYTPPHPVVCDPRIILLILCQMTFSTFREIPKEVPEERLPEVGGCMGLNPRCLVLPFHPSSNLVAPVVLLICMHPGRFGARTHVKKLIENSDRCS